ncbi:MAG: metallophosphoesterase [Nitrososphaeraceae archaeon]|nr:metallophosphoesterase [Nitrososphaeraceae archaeon]
MTGHQNFSIAYPYVNKVFDELNRYGIIPVQDTEHDFETPASSSNPNLDEWKKKLCENGKQEDNNIGIQSICNPSEKTDDKSTDDQQNTETSDKLNKRMEKLNEKMEKSLSDNEINGKSHPKDSQSETENNDDNRGNTERNNEDNNESNDNNEDNDANNDEDKQLLEQQQSSEDQEEEESKAVGGESNDNNNNDDNRGNTERNNEDNNESNDNEASVGIAGLDLNIDKKLTDADKKIENLKDKINKENNNLLFGQQEENKDKEKDNEAKEKDNKAQDDNDQNLGITGLDSKIQKIQANLEKQIENLKDKFENDRDNQRLIEQRNEFDDDDDDDDDGDSKDDDDDDGKDYDGYGFNGDNDDDGKENGEENFNFAAAGDFGCSTNTKNTVENMQSKEPEIVLALGDLSYHSTADCWFDTMSPIKDKLMITLGHHDVEDGQAKMDQYLNSFGLEKPFYSYEYNKVHFLVMSAKSVYYKGSEQYNFILEDLKKAAENKDVNWIVVSSYGPPYTSPSEHTAFKELRDVYHPIFEKYGVDLVLSGHNHNYQRTHPITYNPNDSSEPVVTNDRTTEYNSQKDGIVFAIVGTGGVNFYSFDGQAPFVDTQFANKFGFLNIDISNGNPHTKLTGTFYDNKGDQILDQFTIGKEIKNKNSEVISN